jgi:hypothetical protein
MVAGSSRLLMEAYKTAYVELVKWLTSDYESDKWDDLHFVKPGGKMQYSKHRGP